jgi:hypothetical protein
VWVLNNFTFRLIWFGWVPWGLAEWGFLFGGFCSNRLGSSFEGFVVEFHSVGRMIFRLECCYSWGHGMVEMEV